MYLKISSKAAPISCAYGCAKWSEEATGATTNNFPHSLSDCFAYLCFNPVEEIIHEIWEASHINLG